ncbi:hypothetical protein BX600DRAFT_537499 [Xylariales sp. PMI_506]|nr:hypothetical protein BX600DRAFT_537499 [Xylariales sp. PMI_506]
MFVVPVERGDVREPAIRKVKSASTQKGNCQPGRDFPFSSTSHPITTIPHEQGQLVDSIDNVDHGASRIAIFHQSQPRSLSPFRCHAHPPSDQMGLPLFIAPVESDITSKPGAKSPADVAHARSPIRRERRRQLNETRQHRLQLLAALQSNDAIVPETAPPEPRSQSAENAGIGSEAPALPDRSPSDSDYDELADLIRAEERLERRHALRFLPGTDGLVQEVSYLRGDRNLGPWGQSRGPSGSQEPGASRRLRDLPQISGRLRPTTSRRQGGYEPAPLARSSRSRNPDPGEYLNEYRRRRNAPEGISRSRPRRSRYYVRYVDGLGDRDRSLSPEGDGVWDTLQSTLAPDPQPPSVGSSFASTTASAAASQTAASSSNTSITNPDEEAEPPCEPVGENADSDEDRADGPEEERTESSQRPTSHGGRRSYADVLAEALPSGHDENERMGWLSDMQRIIQGLAARQDIPDQWWAAAGLNRSMSWDESN